MIRPHIILFLLCATIAGFLPLSGVADFQGATHIVPFDEEGLKYNKTAASGPIARLMKELQSGKKLDKDTRHGYLPAVLKELGIDTSSQVLVFSKTSFQRERISPSTPRALYFNDSVYVGYIPGSPILEITEVDPKLGAVFYTLEEKDLKQQPAFSRNDQCLECHASAKSMGVPGHVLRSFMTDKEGIVDLSSGISLVNHRTPFEERWGGWYVTGTHGKQTHRGNLIGKDDFEKAKLSANFRGNVTDLEPFFRTTDYPAKTSDIVALLVLEHQTHMHNFITRYNFEATMALQQYGHVRYMNSITEAFVKYLLFVEEAPLSSSIKGTSSFSRDFPSHGPRDKKGRSFRDLDLETRLFKYPCSYLIYSEAFAALPAPAKERIYKKLFDMLSGKDPSEAYTRLTPEMRQTIKEILLETKSDLPDYWKETTQSASR